MEILIVIFVAAMIGIGAAIFSGKDDGPVEQAAESVIQSQTGVKVDLTPEPMRYEVD